MKTINPTDEVLSVDTKNLVDRFLRYDSTNFVKQAEFLGLDPKEDFRFIDLADVDFSDSNLTGFDFTGSDLRRTYGSNVTGAPILDKADTSDSLFAHTQAQEQYFSKHPDDLRIVERLSSDYWANTVNGVEQLLRTDGGRGSSFNIAMAVFDRTKDPTIRTNILLFMRVGTPSPAEHKAFIYNTLARYSNHDKVVLSGIRALTSFYPHHADAFNWLLKFLEHPNFDVQKAAFIGVARSNKFPTGVEKVTAYILRCQDKHQRIAYVGRVAAMAGMQSVAYDHVEQHYYDFAKPLTLDTARAWHHNDFEAFKIGNEKLKPNQLSKLFLARRLTRLARIGNRFGFKFMFEQNTKEGKQIVPIEPNSLKEMISSL